MEKDYKFKDLTNLSDEDKKVELVNFFDGIDVIWFDWKEKK